MLGPAGGGEMRRAPPDGSAPDPLCRRSQPRARVVAGAGRSAPGGARHRARAACSPAPRSSRCSGCGSRSPTRCSPCSRAASPSRSSPASRSAQRTRGSAPTNAPRRSRASRVLAASGALAAGVAPSARRARGRSPVRPLAGSGARARALRGRRSDRGSRARARTRKRRRPRRPGVRRHRPERERAGAAQPCDAAAAYLARAARATPARR